MTPPNPQAVTPVRSFDIRLRFAMSTSRLPEETLFSFRRNVETKLFFVRKVGGEESRFWQLGQLGLFCLVIQTPSSPEDSDKEVDRAIYRYIFIYCNIIYRYNYVIDSMVS